MDLNNMDELKNNVIKARALTEEEKDDPDANP